MAELILAADKRVRSGHPVLPQPPEVFPSREGAVPRVVRSPGAEPEPEPRVRAAG
jgi:hypothetical protein